jgi:D-xylose transport system substrate-binding protein
VYKAVKVEAQATVAAALYLRAGKDVPASLANGTTTDSTAKTDIKSVLLTPVWVTTANMESTVVKDGYQKVSSICIAELTAACTTAGIS